MHLNYIHLGLNTISKIFALEAVQWSVEYTYQLNMGIVELHCILRPDNKNKWSDNVLYTWL